MLRCDDGGGALRSHPGAGAGQPGHTSQLSSSNARLQATPAFFWLVTEGTTGRTGQRGPRGMSGRSWRRLRVDCRCSRCRRRCRNIRKLPNPTPGSMRLCRPGAPLHGADVDPAWLRAAIGPRHGAAWTRTCCAPDRSGAISSSRRFSPWLTVASRTAARSPGKSRVSLVSRPSTGSRTRRCRRLAGTAATGRQRPSRRR